MAEQSSPTALAAAFTKRIKQLGLSRREVVRQSGISRQTIYNIEVTGHTDLRESTYHSLDEVLKWVPGTSRGLATGELSDAGDADLLTTADRESAFRWQIVLRIANLNSDELVRVIAFIDLQDDDTEFPAHKVQAVG